MQLSITNSPRRRRQGLAGLLGLGLTVSIGATPLGAATSEVSDQVQERLDQVQERLTTAKTEIAAKGRLIPGSVSKWASAEWDRTRAGRTTHAVISIGLDKGAGSMTKTVEVELDDRMCHEMGGTYYLVERSLEGISTEPSGVVSVAPVVGMAETDTQLTLAGTMSHTPSSGPDCSTPTGEPMVMPVETSAEVWAEWSASGDPLFYADGGAGAAFRYQDAKATGVVHLADVDIMPSAKLGRTRTGWIWRGIWAS